jgi:type III secretion protein L
LRSHLESQLRAQVQSQFDAQVRAAVDEAVARTRDAVQREATAQVQLQVQQAVQAATAQFDAALATLAHDAARDALDLAIALTRQLIDGELKQSPAALVGLARTVLQRLGEGRTVTVRLHPDDVAALKSDTAREALSALRIAQLKVQPDARLTRGDLIAETEAGRVEATLEGRLRRLHEALSAAQQADASTTSPAGALP